MDAVKETTMILQAAAGGDRQALNQLLPRVYPELRSIAEDYFQEQPTHHTLQPTALVHEAYLKLIRAHECNWRDRSHFLAVAARAMRQILIDHARARSAAKRGKGLQTISLTHDLTPTQGNREVDVLALSFALDELSKMDERQGRVVEMRFFGGMEVLQIAEVLGVSKTTVDKAWRTAKAWLNVRLKYPA